MTTFRRRDFVAALSALGLSPLALAAHREGSPGNGHSERFLHGVASGDPLHDRVVLWTRITPRRLDHVVEGHWQIATDSRLRHVCNAGRFTTDVSRDFTVKIDADRLDPGWTYYYRFTVRGSQSAIGRTRTLPLGDISSLRLAFASCSNYPYGYFNVLDLNRQRALCSIYHVERVDTLSDREQLAATFVSEVGNNVVRPASPEPSSVSAAQPAPALNG